jgi:putative oxidoreductase
LRNPLESQACSFVSPESWRRVKGRGTCEEERAMDERKPEARFGWLKSFIDNRYLILVSRLTLAAFFLTSSFGKLMDIEQYSVDAVYTFGLLPMALARPFGLALPFIELLCGLGLLFGVLTRLAALGTALMCLSFFIAKGVVLSQGRDIECGCFGTIVDTLASTTIYLDLPLMLLAIMLWSAPPQVRHWKTIGDRLPKAWKGKLHLIW